VQVIVDDGLGLLGRGVAGEDARAQARGHGRQAEVAIVPGSHGGFNRIDELNDRIAAFIKAKASGRQAAQPARPPAAKQ
jgi:hypothetical protein